MGQVRAVLLFLGFVILGYILYDDFDPESLAGKNVVITGASAGIGEQMAYQYARLGARVLITARSEEKLQKVVQHCREVGGKEGVYLYHVADMSISQHAQDLIEAAVKKLGGIDILVLNHIMNSATVDYWRGSPDNFTTLQNVIDINFFSYVRLASFARQNLESHRGRIVVVSSLAGRISQPFLLKYSASKFALEGFFSGFRQELYACGSNVSVTICFLGLVDTESAMSTLERFTRLFSVTRAASASDVAQAMIRGSSLRHAEVFYPYIEVKLSFFIHSIFPKVMQAFTRFLFTDEV